MLTDSHRAGCHNRPDFKPFFYAPEKRIDETGGVTWVSKKIRHTMSSECVTAGSLPECQGCFRATSIC